MTSTYAGHLNIPALPATATESHIVPEMTTHNLLSVGQLCDAGCTATVTKDKIEVVHDNKIIITGTRSPETTLWHLDLPHEVDPDTIFPYHANAAIGTNTAANMVAFMHAAFFSPALSTLEKAMQKGYLPNIPGFTTTTLKKHPPQSAAMIKGHLDQTRQNVRSTKNTTENNEEDEFYPLQLTLPNDEQANYCYATIFSQSGKMYSDQTGNFFQASSKGNLLIMVLYDYDSNAILAEPLKNRKAETILAAYEKMHRFLKSKGMKPKIQVLDNECSQQLKDYMVTNNIKYQLAAPGQHRTNAAERAIRTFKNHFVAGLCSTDEHFPLHLWDRLIEQAVITLNLLRGSRMNPQHSAWSQLNGPYDHNAYPLAPPGIHVLVHEKPDMRKSWAPHANDAWYLGPAMEHYRCFRVYMRETQSERITDTLTWFPKHVPLPTATSTELIVAGLQDVVEELQNPTVPNAIINVDNNKRNTLKKISNMLTTLLTENTTEDVATGAAVPRVTEDGTMTTTDTSPPRVSNTIHSDTDHTESGDTTPKAGKQVTFNADAPVLFTYEYVNARTGTTKFRSAKDAPTEKYPKKPQYEKYSHKRVTRASSNHAYVVQQAPEFALFGNAINPDTNQPAEYLELSKCSEGEEWIKFGVRRIWTTRTRQRKHGTGRNRNHTVHQHQGYTRRKETNLPQNGSSRPTGKSQPKKSEKHHWRGSYSIRWRHKHESGGTYHMQNIY